MSEELSNTPFIFAAIAVGISAAVTYWLFRTILQPKGAIATRLQRGRLFAGYAASVILFATLSRAITSGGDANRIIAAAILPPIAWALGFAIGWVFGPSTPSPNESGARGSRFFLRSLMTERVAIAAIVAVGIVAAVGVYSYFSPYNSCVRGVISGGAPEHFANLQCAKRLSGNGS